MGKRRTAPPGASITEDTEKNEAGDRMSKVSSQAKTFDNYILALKEAEAKSLKPRSGDYEVLKDVPQKEVMQLQEDKRLVGFQQFGKGNVCLVLKEAFITKKETLKKEIKSSGKPKK